MRVELKCAECGSAFSARPSARRRFCSLSCAVRSRTGAASNAWKGGMITRSCEACGASFSRYPSTAARFCSKGCVNSSKIGRAGRAWKSGISVSRHGYVSLLMPGGHRLEHRLVMEAVLGRPLRNGENVHHRNGVRSDNRPENLELWLRPQPSGIRASDYATAPCGGYCGSCP